MISYVKGEVLFCRKESVVVDVHGIGLEVFTPNAFTFQSGGQAAFYTYMQVKEDGMLLYGFATEAAYEFFCRLIKVKGVGPRMAMNMLGAMDAPQIMEAIEAADLKALKSLPGVGAKVASQLILDLKGKVVLPKNGKSKKEPEIRTAVNPVWEDTRQALLSLGYRPAELESLEAQMVQETTMTVDGMLRKSLQYLAARNGV